MSDVEQIHEAEIVEESPSWEELVSEWTAGASLALAGQLKQARAAANVQRVYGRKSVEAFAKEVGASKSTVYDYARVWQMYGHLFEDGEYSGRLETLSMAQLVEAAYSPDPVTTAERAEDEGLSSRQIRAERREPSSGAGPDGSQGTSPPDDRRTRNVEVIELVRCPHCEKEFSISEASVRTVER